MKLASSPDPLIIPVWNALKALGDSGSNEEIVNKIIEQLKIPYDVANKNHSRGRQTKLEYYSAWARTKLKVFGVLDNPDRGIWAIVPGKQNTTISVDQVRRVFREKRINTKKKVGGQHETKADGESDIEESWRDELLAVLTTSLSPNAFERLTQRILRACDFTNVQVTGRSGDGGIDGTATAMINDLLSFPVIFQCKRYNNTAVNAEAIRSFHGAMLGRADRGLFVTTSRFTREARAEAIRDGVPPIDLIDGNKLMDKLKELKMGLEVETVEKVTINKDWYQKI